MKKYTLWHTLKLRIENTCREKKFRDREIWWCSLGENIGFEQDGKNENFERPVLVLRKFNKEIFFGLPLTSKEKHDKFHAGFVIKTKDECGHIQEKASFAMLSQMRLFSSKRMIRRIVRINENTFNDIKEKFIQLITEKPNGPLSGSSGA
jgi:mRNA interferase MazF